MAQEIRDLYLRPEENTGVRQCCVRGPRCSPGTEGTPRWWLLQPQGWGRRMGALTIPNVTCREPLALSALYSYMLNQINLTKTDDLWAQPALQQSQTGARGSDGSSERGREDPCRSCSPSLWPPADLPPLPAVTSTHLSHLSLHSQTSPLLYTLDRLCATPSVADIHNAHRAADLEVLATPQLPFFSH